MIDTRIARRLFAASCLLAAALDGFAQDYPVNSLKDFTPIIHSFAVPSFLVVHSSLPVSSVKELMDFARKHPGKLAYGSTGLGSPFHLLGESFKILAGVDMLHVPSAPCRSAPPSDDPPNGLSPVYRPRYPTTKPFVNS